MTSASAPEQHVVAAPNATEDCNNTIVLSASPTSVTAGQMAPERVVVEPLELSPKRPSDTTTSIKSWRILSPSAKSKRSVNPIRSIVDPIVANIQSGEARGDGKNHISLALGDPTAARNLPPCPIAVTAVTEALQSSSHAAGYINACGLPQARQAVAQYHSNCNNTVSPEQVVIASGCSGALELALTALLEEDSILLVPQPGFPIYQVIAESHGAHVVHYRLLQPTDDDETMNGPDESNWECDLQHLRELMRMWGHRVKGLVVNNPGNPTGAVFSKAHLCDILRFCEEHQLPVVSDEIYGDLTFGQHVFYPLADIAANMGRQVPIITASGIGKQYLLPGWRVGWVVFQDNIYGSLSEVEAGTKRLAQIILGASHLAQTAVPALLQKDEPDIIQWKRELRKTLEKQANFLREMLSTCHGLHILRAGGAMYTIIRLDVQQFDETIRNDLDFSRALLKEENIFVLPGSCFGMPNVFRAVFCAPIPVLEEAASRMKDFCQRHAKH